MRYLFILITFFCFLVSLSVYFTFKAQFNLFYEDRASKKILTLEDFESQFSLFPNITATSIPIPAIRAVFATNEKKFILADSLLSKADIINPYIGYSDYVKSLNYYAFGNIDSSTYYARKAFIKWPKSPDNYKQYLKTLAYVGDTIGIVNAYGQIDSIFKDRSYYSKEFINFYNIARLKFLITDYKDRSSIKLTDLNGTWMKCFEYEGGKIQYDSLVKISFNNGKMIGSSGDVYNFKLINDSLSIYAESTGKLIVTNLLEFSKEYNTLILTPEVRSKKVEQFFKKIE